VRTLFFIFVAGVVLGKDGFCFAGRGVRIALRRAMASYCARCG
jgi:hypothetical protein